MENIVLGILILWLIFIFVLLIKNEVTCRNHLKINDAIYKRHVHLIVDESVFWFDVDYLDMEPYDKTLFRLWDWGYTRILPPDKFELIKPFLLEDKNEA